MNKYCIIAGLQFENQTDFKESFEETCSLAEACGYEVIETMVQPRRSAHPSTLFGSGKLAELQTLIHETKIDTLIISCDITPSQMRTLKDLFKIRILDRTDLILEIFASRARTKEARLQVELATLKHQLPYLIRTVQEFSRQGGVGGARNKGEGEQLELDRRKLETRIQACKRELDSVVNNRDTMRRRRKKAGVPMAALAGYTNAGKSTLLNKLTDAGVLSENKLFATLDPTTRSMELPNGEKVLLTDTVGFIRKLPHNLIEAFKSTLEEAKYADIIVHVVDVSNPNYEQQMSTVYATLKQLGVEGKPVVTLFNKCDVLPEKPAAKDLHADYTYNISAVRGNGLEAFKECLQEIILKSRIRIERVFPYSEAGKIQLIRQFGQLESEEYTEDGIKVLAYVPKEIEGKL